MRISDILSTKGSQVSTVRPDSTVRELVAELNGRNVGAVVVSTDGRKIDGIVSERDVVRRLTVGAEVLGLTVADLMTSALFTCSPGDSIADAMATMTEHRVRHLPVVVGGELSGIVSIGDVVKASMAELKFERDQLEDYVRSGG